MIKSAALQPSLRKQTTSLCVQQPKSLLLDLPAIQPPKAPLAPFYTLALIALLLVSLRFVEAGTPVAASNSVGVAEPTYCASIPEGLAEYQKWLKNPDARDLGAVLLRFGGEMVSPGQQLRLEEKALPLALLRTPVSKMLCYLPAQSLVQQ